MRAEKLPSGSWRCRVYRDGVRRSFTASTKKEAETMAAAWVAGEHEERMTMTVGEAIRRYIDVKEPVLSPSTVVGYRSLSRTAYAGLEKLPLSKLATGSAQAWLSDYAGKYSPKRVRNAYGLLVAAVGMFRPALTLKLTLPQPEKPRSRTPDTGKVLQLLEYTRGRDPLLYAAILLAAFGTLRRGEVCALRGKDLDHAAGTVTVRCSMVEAPCGGVVEKTPKSAAGARVVTLPRQVMAELPITGPEEHVIPWLPYHLTHRFAAAARACELDVTFHGLRHYAASILHAWNVPEAYAKARGGWSSDVYARVYREALEDEKRRQDRLISDRIGHELATLLPPMEVNPQTSAEI